MLASWTLGLGNRDVAASQLKKKKIECKYIREVTFLFNNKLMNGSKLAHAVLAEEVPFSRSKAD